MNFSESQFTNDAKTNILALFNSRINHVKRLFKANKLEKLNSYHGGDYYKETLEVDGNSFEFYALNEDKKIYLPPGSIGFSGNFTGCQAILCYGVPDNQILMHHSHPWYLTINNTNKSGEAFSHRLIIGISDSLYRTSGVNNPGDDVRCGILRAKSYLNNLQVLNTDHRDEKDFWVYNHNGIPVYLYETENGTELPLKDVTSNFEF